MTDRGEKSDTKTSTEPVQSTPGSEPSSQSVNTDELVAEVKVLRGTVEQLTSMVATLLKHLNSGVATADVITTSDKGECKARTQTDILNRILEHSQPLSEQKRYKSITLEQIAKENKPERKKDLHQAYDILNERRLLTATNRPHDGWKFDFQRKSIELLFRVGSRHKAVYNTRHRPLYPRMIDGKLVKEEATAGEKYLIPYGLEKLDYSYKTIFVTEGIYDSCFLKNCLAYSNWILPTEMSKVIDIYREAGFQIIHILDNFRLGDKGGVRGLELITERRDWLSKGDKVFSWDIYSEFKDFNDIAMAYGLDEIDPQTIIDNSWNEDEARANYQAFMPIPSSAVVRDVESEPVSSSSQDVVTSVTKPAESIYIEDDELSALLDEFQEEQQQDNAERERNRVLQEQRFVEENEDMDVLLASIYNNPPITRRVW